MLRRIKKIFGFSSRGSYCPHNDDQSANGSIVSTASQKSNKKSKKDNKISPLTEPNQCSDKSNSSLAVAQSITSSKNLTPTPSAVIIIGGEETVVGSDVESGTGITDSSPNRKPSDNSQSLTNSTNVDQSSAPEGASTCSIAGSVIKEEDLNQMGLQKPDINEDSYVDSIYSSDSNLAGKGNNPLDQENGKLMKEMAVDCGEAVTSGLPHSDASSLCVQLPTTPNMLINNDDDNENENTPRTTSSSIAALRNPLKDDEHEAKYRQLNENLKDLLTNPAPFKVSTARLPLMKKEMLDDNEGDEKEKNDDEDEEVEEEEDEDERGGFDYMFDEAETNNSVARILNESHETSMKSLDGKHLKSFGY